MTLVDTSFNQQSLRERLFNDAELIKEIAGIFLEDTPQHIAELKSYVVTLDYDSAKKTAHKIKGAAANMSAEPLQQLAKQMEHAGEQKDAVTLEECMPELEHSYSSLEKSLLAFLNKL